MFLIKKNTPVKNVKQAGQPSKAKTFSLYVCSQEEKEVFIHSPNQVLMFQIILIGHFTVYKPFSYKAAQE